LLTSPPAPLSAVLQEECKGKEAASEEIDAVLEVQGSGVLPQLVSAGTGHNDNRSTAATAVKSKPIDYHAIMLKESPRDVVRKRLQWMVDHAAEGQMPVGEAICGVTGNFVPSSTPNIYEYAGVYIWVRASSLRHHTLSLLEAHLFVNGINRPYSWSRACAGCPTPSDGPFSKPTHLLLFSDLKCNQPFYRVCECL
jgi:hypothetical protein